MKKYNIPFMLPVALLASSLFSFNTSAQVPGPDAAPGIGLWRSDPDYPMPYGVVAEEQVLSTMQRLTDYIDRNCPIRWIDLESRQPITPGDSSVQQPGLEYGLFAPVSYEWGVTYAGLLLAAEVTGDARYLDYVRTRFEAIDAITQHYLRMPLEQRPRRYLARGLIHPANLDQCGSMAAALIKASQVGIGTHLMDLIEPALHFIRHDEKRLSDGTFARDRPLPDSLWLDDLYMSVPALAQWGHTMDDASALNDACAQLIGMHQRMFIETIGLYRHGWVKSMHPHPTFPWGRANGWTIMATVELLSVLPESHPQFPEILNQFRMHVAGIAAHQGIHGFWHQLLDRPETYEESSCTAMFVFALARGINRGWIDAAAYGPVVTLGWHALSTAVDASGAFHGTCVGTGMGWDPAFYAYRPISIHAAHGYGPLLLAGAETIRFLRGAGRQARLHDSAVHIGQTPDW
jgi:unsaturated rhamnogalacturonyl hydrolase